jgi:hypothetical protein
MRLITSGGGLPGVSLVLYWIRQIVLRPASRTVSRSARISSSRACGMSPSYCWIFTTSRTIVIASGPSRSACSSASPTGGCGPPTTPLGTSSQHGGLYWKNHPRSGLGNTPVVSAV